MIIMRCRIAKYVTLILLAAASGVHLSCDKVSTLSDSNVILSAEVKSSFPVGLQFDTPVIEGEKIILPLRFGKYLFPAKINLDFKTAGKIPAILGPDDEGFLSFDSPANIRYLYVVSESGLTKKYQVSVRILPSGDLAEIEELNSYIVSGTDTSSVASYIDPVKSEVTIYTHKTNFPLSLVPDIKLSPGATFSGYTAGTKFNFNEPGSFTTLQVISESGRLQNWNIFLKIIIPAENNFEGVPEEVKIRLNNAVKAISPSVISGNLKIDTVLKSSIYRDISIYGSQTPTSKIDLHLVTAAGISVIWPHRTSAISLSEWNKAEKLILCDLMTGYSATWNVILKEFGTRIEVTGFSWNKIVSPANQVVTGSVQISESERLITIPVSVSGFFPAEFMNISVTTNGTINGMGNSLLFSSMSDEKEFLILKGGLAEKWRVKLKDGYSAYSSKADVTGFSCGPVSYGYNLYETYIEQSSGKITIVADLFPEEGKLWIKPQFALAPGASLEGIVPGGVIGLEEGKEYLFNINAENGEQKTWSLRVIKSPQIPGSNFENWITHPQFSTIDQTIAPSDGSGWNSSNNPSVQGVTKTSGFESDYAAKISTALTTVNFGSIVSVTSLTAGSMFLGNFRYSILTRDVYNPSNMTLMGVLFDGKKKPLSFSFMYKYSPGDQIVRTAPRLTSVNIPAFEPPVNISGTDAAVARVELWQHNSSLEFDVNKEPAENRIASGEFIVNEKRETWNRGVANINYLAGKENSLPTHIVVSFTSSRDGLHFTGAAGSILVIDNFRLNYYNPSEGSIIIK